MWDMIQVYHNGYTDSSILHHLPENINPHHMILKYLPMYVIRKIEWKTENLCYVYCLCTTFIFSKRLF